MGDRRAIGPDILRALAILLVMSWHFPWVVYPPEFQAVKDFGWLGVDIFFVLSGYLIGSELLRPVAVGSAPDLRVFYVKRAFRILPMFWLTLAVYALFPAIRERQDLAPVWRYLTFTLNFGQDARIHGAFTHAWSLCVEEHFYLVLPLMVLILRRFRTPWPAVVLAAGVLVGGMVLRHVLWSAWQTVDPDNGNMFMKTFYYPSYNRLDGLLMGVIMAALRLFHANAWKRYAKLYVTLPLAAICLGVTGYINAREGVSLGPWGASFFTRCSHWASLPCFRLCWIWSAI